MASQKQSVEYDFDRLVGLDIVDIYDAIERPAEFSMVQESGRNAITKVLIEAGLGNASADQIESFQKRVYIAKAKEFDLKVLDAFGLSVDDFIALVMIARKRKYGGRTVHPETPKQKVIAVYAFRWAHQNQKTRGEALSVADKWLAEYGFNKSPSKITIGKWLDELNYFYPSILLKSNRGRKKLK